MQPSEVDRLSTYEFRKYMSLLSKQIKEDQEYQQSLAQAYGVGAIFSSKER